MNDMTTHDATEPPFGGRALVALFPTADSARAAATQLREDAFHGVWVGITHAAPVDGQAGPNDVASRIPGELVVESGGESVGEKIGRFFSGETSERSLFHELTRHGVDREQALRLEDQIPPESAIVTVDGANHPEAAASTIEACGGHVIAGESFATGSGEAYDDAASDPRRGSQVLGYQDPERYARGGEIGEGRRLQLRSERLNIDKQQSNAGEASVGTTVVERRSDVDVPVVHEELFIERRPARADAQDSSGVAIGSADTIKIPLMREHVVVTKRPVVTAEYVVGKRAVTETEHVSETTREEQLSIQDPSTATAGGRSAADTP